MPGQLLVRRLDGNDLLASQVEQILERRQFTSAPQLADSAVCPELAERLAVYNYAGEEDARIENTRTALTELQAVDGAVRAGPTLVTALHQSPSASSRIVVKAAVGPAPTTVDGDDQAFREAGSRSPLGEVIVAVIDTGIAEATREDGRLNEVSRSQESIDPLDAFPSPGNGFLDFAAGHGTFAAGIVRLVDPEAQIKVYTALDSDGFATENDVACAMIQAVKDGAHVLNLSLGMHTVDNTPSVALELALVVIDEIATSQGRDLPAIVASAGNYGDTELVWPAAFTERVISVAGLTAELEPAAWSSHGEWITCSCVGEGIVSTFVPGDEDPTFSDHHPEFPSPDHYPLGDTGDAWAVWTGTSFAAPQIAGAISRKMREEAVPPGAAAQLLLAGGAAVANYGQALHLLSGT